MISQTLLFAVTALDELERQHGESGCTRAIRKALKEAADGQAERSKLADTWDQYGRSDIDQEEFEGVIAEMALAARDAAKERT